MKIIMALMLVFLAMGLGACSSATAPCVASDEVCNGVDDDCDGVTDEDPVDVTSQACGSDVGECQAGVEACEDGQVVCRGQVGPQDEVCNNADDDCDGDTDEDLEHCACTTGAPSRETCNGEDDDCNGQIDDDPAEAGQPCGNDEGECQAGVQACVDGQIVCQGQVGPQDEVCNNADDDCDGDTDEELSGCGCTGGQSPSAEVCNQVDDDCNGQVDEGLPACACSDGGLPGAEVCNQVDDDCNGRVDDGLSACACSDGGQATAETCNMIDDDCDGQVDEDNGSGGGCGQLGEPCTTYTQCTSQICIGDIFARYCSQQCQPDDPGSCPDGYECFIGSNMDYCRKVWPSCESDDDCSPDMVCTVQDAPDGLSVNTECRPPLDPGAQPGEDCSSDTCANDLCSSSGMCSEICSETSPCTDQYQGMDTSCLLTGFYVLPGSCGRDEQCPSGYSCVNSRCHGPSCSDSSECEPGYACTDSICSPAWQLDRVGTCQVTCSGDSDCVEPMVCQLGITIDGTAIQGKCSPAYNGNPTGGSCVPDGCDHGLCITSDDYCTQLCGDAGDCPAGWNCTLLNWNVGSLGTFPAYACTIP